MNSFYTWDFINVCFKIGGIPENAAWLIMGLDKAGKLQIEYGNLPLTLAENQPRHLYLLVIRNGLKPAPYFIRLDPYFLLPLSE